MCSYEYCIPTFGPPYKHIYESAHTKDLLVLIIQEMHSEGPGGNHG